MLGLFRVGSVHCPSVFVLSGGITNATFEADSHGLEASCFHSLAEGFCNAPSIVGDDDQTGGRDGPVHARTRFNLHLPTAGTRLQGRCGGMSR